MALTPEQLRWFSHVVHNLQIGQRQLTLGGTFPQNWPTSLTWWLPYFRIWPSGASVGTWELTAEGIRLAALLRLRGEL